MTFKSGTRLGSFEILAPLGAGGMGEVYRARDPNLGREVAIKVLPDSLAKDADALARFQVEARALAALSHPNILAIFDLGSQDGVTYAVMELLEGETLRERLQHGVPLPQRKAVEYAREIARGLSAAHEKEIVHRDLKPENVFVTKDERVKILDFGLAKRTGKDATDDVTSAPTQSKRTEPGTVMGSVGYMAPEQVRGLAVDHRADIFALGAILYEMLTGKRAFKGQTPSDTLLAVLRDEPPELSQSPSSLPPALTRILRHCLEKSPGARAQSAHDLAYELEHLDVMGTHTPPAPRSKLWIAVALAAAVALGGIGYLVSRRGMGEVPPAATSPPPAAADSISERSIAVLPFVNMSSDKEQEYFSDGISEELLNLLAKVQELKVSARTSSFSFKGKEVEVPEIARQLHVAHVLEGSVRKSGNQVRITAQLIHASDGFHVWSRTYDRTLDDVFKIQDEIAAEVVKELKVTLLGAPPQARTTDPKAYALYLQARQVTREVTSDAFPRADALYRQALAIDPRYAPAWRGLGVNLANEATYQELPSEEGYARAREAVEKALAIDPDYAAAYALLGNIALWKDNDLEGAAKYLERALQLDPSDASVLGAAANLLEDLGRPDEALAVLAALVRRDPLNVTWLNNLGLAQYSAGRFDSGIETLRAALALSPGRVADHYNIGVALLLKHDAPGALAEIEKETSETWRSIGLPLAYHALGRKADSDTALATLIAKTEKEGPYNIAYVYAFRGEADKAFEWLDKAVRYKDGSLSDIPTDPVFENIRSDPRWLPFLRKIGKAPDQLAKIPFKVTLPKD